VVSGTSDYYAQLGIGRDASADDIKRAYRAKAREHHPDISDDHDAEERFKAVNEAYEVLSDPEKRQMYDRFGTADPRAGGGGYGDPFGGMGAEDLFSVFFGGGFGGQTQTAPTHGRDMAAQVAVTLEEAASGADKEITYSRDATCPDCEGTGAAEGGSVVTCPDCGGTGQRVTTRQTFLGAMRTAAPCQRCSATGVTIDHPCPKCSGSGRAPLRESIAVHVPPGIQDGMTLRVEDRGEAGLRGDDPGDLLVSVNVRQHPTLHRQGDDLHMHVSVPVARALLGGEVTVPGLSGPETVEIPAGSKAGDSVRIKGHGMPKPDGRSGLFSSSSGDLYVHLDLDVPHKLSRDQKRLVEELRESLGSSDDLSADRLSDWLH
jgi:molecular chaperone DnaJ